MFILTFSNTIGGSLSLSSNFGVDFITVESSQFVIYCHIRELVESVKRSEQSPETPDKYDGGLYVGRAGIAYMLWYVSTKQPDLAHNLESARELAFAHYRWSRIL